MNEILRELISTLPKSPTSLDKSTVEKIHRYIPVPTDYKILWADVGSLGGYPAGVVITDRAIIIKASREEARNNKSQIKQENMKSKERVKAPKTIYQIIPWEYYSPEDYDIVAVKDARGHIHYVLKAGTTELAQFSSKGLYSMLTAYKKKAIEAREAAEATFSAINTVNVEGVMFSAAYGVDQTKTGHGIYAEEAGAILDKLVGERSTVVGRDNAKNGPDKIVDSSPIQCKYCKRAYNSVDACFQKNPQTGDKSFRYYDLNGNTMKVEVPADQYAQAIEYMKTRIMDGQVPGVTDPNAAYDIIRKGRLTYNQALNLAKAGTIESITFDAYTGAVNCLSVFGISAVVSFAQTYWVTKDYKKAAKSAIFTGLQVYGMAFAGGIIASQLSRTGLVSALNPVATETSKAISPQMAQEIINAFRALAGKKAIYGVAAQKSFAKFLGSTAIMQSVMFIVFSVPDTFKVINGKISGSQYWKNMTSLFASFTGSIVATTTAGSLIGKTIGEKVDKKVGAVIGMGAGVIGGAVCGTAAKGIGNLIHEDDAVIVARLFNCVLLNQFMDNMLTSEEQDTVIKALDDDEKQLRQLQQNLRKSETQESDIIKYLGPKIEVVIKGRSRIGNAAEQEMEQNIKSIVLKGELAYGL